MSLEESINCSNCLLFQLIGVYGSNPGPPFLSVVGESHSRIERLDSDFGRVRRRNFDLLRLLTREQNKRRIGILKR